jgi:hypothetical protein
MSGSNLCGDSEEVSTIFACPAAPRRPTLGLPLPHHAHGLNPPGDRPAV